jgi:hypothetical protein
MDSSTKNKSTNLNDLIVYLKAKKLAIDCLVYFSTINSHHNITF